MLQQVAHRRSWGWRIGFSIMLLLLFTRSPRVLAQAQTSSQGLDGTLQIAHLGQCKLDSGQVIQDCKIGYRTFGHLNAARDNAILFPTWYMGTSEDLMQYFGPDKLVDTTRFFGVALDALANGVSSSPSNSVGQHGAAFPQITIRDMVRAEYRVATEVLHLQHAHAVVGISMGGMQTFTWAVSHPDFFDLAVPIVGTPRQTSYDLLNWQTRLDAIRSDPDYKNGNYTRPPNLTLANELGVMTLTTPMYRVGRTSRAQYETFLAAARTDDPSDANNRVWQLRAMMGLDLIGNSHIATVAKNAHPKFFIVVAAQDHLVNPTPALDWAAAIGAPTYVSHGNCGHEIFLCDDEGILESVRPFLAGTKR